MVDSTKQEKDTSSLNLDNMVFITGGKFLMGSDNFYPEEKPVHEVTVDSFYIDKYEVTNADFKKFVDETGYVTVAERPLNPADYPGAKPELLVPGALVFRKSQGPVNLNSYFNWWQWVPGTSWKHPHGPQSSILGIKDHPVVHIAYEDAEVYAKWAGKELPTEAEWEYAARGGLIQKKYPWGDVLRPDGQHQCNIWQGTFPTQNNAADGYAGTAPSRSFPANGYGLYNMSGNVWEWCADNYVTDHEKSILAETVASPDEIRKVLKGGSYLCHRSYCNRYRVAARISNTPDTSTGHIGFRCASDVLPV